MGPPYDAVLFDFDGVLVDSEPVHYECWRTILLDYGFKLEWSAYQRHFLGVSDREMVARLVACSPVPLSASAILARYPEKRDLFRQRMQSEVPLSPGVVELFRDLSGLPLGVVTSSLRLEVEPVLERCGLLARLAVVVYGDDVRRHKPDPEPYQVAAQRIGAQRPLVVEDSNAGEASARAAGFDVVRVPEPAIMAAVVRQRLNLASVDPARQSAGACQNALEYGNSR
ncbi:MAG: HAD family phosphatase [Bryobacteraceae bacterium]|nr:HAD family phosphatase [Bryobacteraceae bacterium]MDW8377512.1 HAD family phosphatase [Bryobacterales bacterium]